MAYVKPKSHKKKNLSDIVKKSKGGGALDSRYSVKSLRANMSTGGGQPIPKGHKWTTEKRVEQPRDPVTQQFEYNASADLGLEYKSRGKKIPIAARRLGISENVFRHTGNVVLIDGDTWVNVRGDDLTHEQFVDFFKEWHEGDKDFVNKENTSLTKMFDKKRGRMSKAEKEAQKNKDYVVNEHYDFQGEVGPFLASKKKVSTKMFRELDKDSDKFKSNKKWNEDFDKRNSQPKPTPAPAPAPKPQPAPAPAPAPAKKGGFDYNEAKKSPKAYYEANREMIDERLKAFNEKHGTNWTAARYVNAMINKYEKKNQG